MSTSFQTPTTNGSPMATADPFQGFLDIPMEVIVDLGTTKIKISELLTIEPGSVIGLSQLVGADLVALEDRTCVRITELLAE